jgi:feruloyl-CoA synthase
VNTKTARRVRRVNVLGAEAIFDRSPDGVLYVRSPRRLGSYPDKLTERLEHWAVRTPDHVFLAQRDSTNSWRRITYSETLRRVRSIAQALLDRHLHTGTSVAILSGNSIEHALLALASMYAGIPYAPIAPSYSLASVELATLRNLWQRLEPALVFAADGDAFERPLSEVLDSRTEVVTLTPAGSMPTTPFQELTNVSPTSAVNEAHARVTSDTVAKILFTSGSTGRPKGVVTTQRMLCSNQEMLRTLMGFLADGPPVLCDWLPWNHTFGGSHNFGITLYNGGTLYIDEGRPTTSAGFAATVANLREIATTAYFNVPKGFEMLLPALRADQAFRTHFFSRIQILFYAAAGLKQQVWDELQDLAVDACGEEILMMTGLGATETAPMALSTGVEGAAAGRVGLPVPGVELKVSPVENKLEARLRGPNVTPGFWRDPEMTRAAFDDEGFYKLGDALVFADPDDPLKGFRFDGRIAEDFKLSTGSWVSVGPLRARFLTWFDGVAQDVVFAAPDRDFVTAMIFPQPGARFAAVRTLLESFARQGTGISTRVERAILLDQGPSLDAGEFTDKGTINQKAVLRNRASLVEELYAGSERVIEIDI